MPKHVDKRVVETAKKALRALEPETKYLSARQAVAELQPDIRAAMEKGYSVQSIAEVLGEHLKITPETLKGYLYGRGPAPAPAPRARRKKSA